MNKNQNCMALDRDSVRTVDENGYMHVASSHITKATVNPYYGNEVPGWQEAGLDPDKIYYGFRHPEELQKSLSTWAGLPLHIEHHLDSAEDPQKLTRVGSVGTEVVWNPPYVDAPLTVWDDEAITAIKNDSFRELSCAYRYEPEWTAGEYEGVGYDFIMRNIRGNHVALVEEGRAGPDVLVADSNTISKSQREEKPMADIQTPDVEKKEVDLAQAIIDLHKVDPETGEVQDEETVNAVRTAVDELVKVLSPADVEKLNEAVTAINAPAPADEPAKEGEDEEEPVAVPAADEDDFKEAAAARGLEAENEAILKAFAEGVKYAGELHAHDEEEVPADEEETADEDVEVKGDEEEVAAAADKKLGKRSKKVAFDAKAVKAQAIKETRQHMQALFAAVETVRPITGALAPMSFDSAEDVYKQALIAKGINPAKYDRSAWRGMVDVLLQSGAAFKPMAKDSNPADFSGPFSGLKNVILS